jgi:hypothetical protein
VRSAQEDKIVWIQVNRLEKLNVLNPEVPKDFEG